VKWLVCDATSAARLSIETGLFFDTELKYGLCEAKSGKWPWPPRRFPGVELNTEYSSANLGVESAESSNVVRSSLGVCRTEAGKTAEVGVCLGVGGWGLELPKLELFPSPLISARAKGRKVVARSALCEKHNNSAHTRTQVLLVTAGGAITGEQECMRRLLAWRLSRAAVLGLD